MCSHRVEETHRSDMEHSQRREQRIFAYTWSVCSCFGSRVCVSSCMEYIARARSLVFEVSSGFRQGGSGWWGHTPAGGLFLQLV